MPLVDWSNKNWEVSLYTTFLDLEFYDFLGI